MMKEPSNLIAVMILFVAALLEAGGDALVRNGLRAGSLARGGGWILLGGLTLLAYGFVVNAPRWNFGRLLGVYVVLFFLVAQGIAWLGFRERPTFPLMVGGIFIILGGGIISLWN
jgi:small multidrug resistance family-3 protein